VYAVKMTLSRVEAYGLHGRFSIELDLNPHINVIYGRNGSGKTTLLHIIANILNNSFDRFAFLRFRRIVLVTSADNKITVVRQPDDTIRVTHDNEEVIRFSAEDIHRTEAATSEWHDEEEDDEIEEPDLWAFPRPNLAVPRVAYFPAFRTVIEADRSATNYQNSLAMARRLFGSFVPSFRYPTPATIERDLGARVRAATFQVARKNQEIFSDAFINVFAALSGTSTKTTSSPEPLLADIGNLLAQLDTPDEGLYSNVYRRLRERLPSVSTQASEITAVLEVYRQSLKAQLEFERQTFAPIQRYLNAVNDFLEGKKLVVKRSPAPGRQVLVQFDDGSSASLSALSSGERQIVSMLFAATYLGRGGDVVLIDEPELSLHIDWQRKLLSRMAAQLGERQIIVCTHSIEVGADCMEYQVIQPRPWSDSSHG